MKIGVPTGVFRIHLFSVAILAWVLINVETRLAGILAPNMAIPICLVAAAPALSTCTRKKVIGTNDVDQIKKNPANRASEQLEITRVGWDALRRCVQRHRACSDAEKPVRKWRHARVETDVSDWNIYRDRTERSKHERASAGRGNLRSAGIGQRYTTPQQLRRVLTGPARPT